MRLATPSHSPGRVPGTQLLLLVSMDEPRVGEVACPDGRAAEGMLGHVAYLLTHYIPRSAWEEWLKEYGYNYNRKVLSKVFWYGQLGYLNQITKHIESYDLEAANKEIYALRLFRQQFNKEL